MTEQNTYVAKGYRVAPKSADDIRLLADRVRRVLKPEEFSGQTELFLASLMKYGINYDVLDEEGLNEFGFGPIEAAYIPTQSTIYFSDATYSGIIENTPRARFTVFHELGHCLLNHNLALHRGDHQNIKPFEDSEWQANQFAAEIMMPLEIIKQEKLTTPLLLMAKFDVSNEAARVRLNNLERKGLIQK